MSILLPLAGRIFIVRLLWDPANLRGLNRKLLIRVGVPDGI